MVGLDRFKEAFAEFSDNYVIIGGTACDIAMTGTAVRPRATHDIDMIVVVENMTPEFGKRFWDFIKEAGYRPERTFCLSIGPSLLKHRGLLMNFSYLCS